MNYIKRFRDFLINNGVGLNTVDNYINYVKKYIKWYEGDKGDPFRFLRKDDVTEYISQFIQSSSRETVKVNLTGLRRFNEFLVVRGIQENMVVDKKIFDGLYVEKAADDGDGAKTVITEQEVEQFRMYVCSNDSIRNYAIVTVLAYAGLKLTECIELKVQDIDFDNHLIYVRGNLLRHIPMDSKVEASLKLYLNEREYGDYQCEFLFASRSDKKLDRTMINKIFQKYKKEFNITTNTLRNFYCSRLKKQGYSGEEISLYAGYKPQNNYVDKIIKRV